MIIKTIRVLMGDEVRQFRDTPELREHLLKSNHQIIGEVTYTVNGWADKAMVEIYNFRSRNKKEPKFLILGHNVYHEMEKETQKERQVGYAMLQFCGLSVLKVIESDFVGVA